MNEITYRVSWIEEQVHEKDFGSDHVASHDFKDEMKEKGMSNVRLWRCMKCGCGEEVILQGDTECNECGALYNGFGQRLVPRDMWEERWEE